MKRAYVVVGSAAVVVLLTAGAIVVAKGDDPSTGASKTLTQRELQAEQMEKAQKELARQATEFSEQQRKSEAHQLLVTMREESPYDAYKPEPGGENCVRVSDAPSQLVVEDVSGEYPEVIAEQEIPGTAKLKEDSACEATIAVDVPFAAEYRLGIAIEGHGMSLPTDPGPLEVKVTNRHPQKVVVLR
ncbi:hypothetical protein GCM10022234_29720 [Aeromicrobium panaciterrae]|uniref:hypothetical protein n=1 Tax=Aeromicrobium panaciterrae TaxID=363861 RepID=UPI0031D8D64C